MATYDTASAKVASFLMSTMTEVNNAYAAKVRSCCFLNNTTLKSAKFSAITAIEGNAFKGCTALTSVNLPNTLTTIASTAFDGCTALTNITIHKGTDSITGSPWGATNATVTWAGDTPTNVYDDTVTDINGYMRYADQKFNFTSDSTDLTSNAVTYFMAEANTAYTITMGMDTRFRAWSYNGMPASSGLVMSNYVINALDDNTSTSQNGATETLTITTVASDDRVFIGYWSKGGSVERLNVRNTISVVKG